jgi:hypothetical protein
VSYTLAKLVPAFPIDTRLGYWYNTFSVYATIAAPFLYLLGGYVNVTNTNLLALIADVSDDNVYR